MSKSNPSEMKLAVLTSGGFSGLKSLSLQVFTMIAAIIMVMLFFTWTTNSVYLSVRSVSNLLRQIAITGILAVGMVFVIISAEIDLSVGLMMGLLGGVAAICDVRLGWSLPLTIIVTLVLGLLLGTWNGWRAVYRKVPSLVVTPAGMLAFRGILIGITSGTTVSPAGTTMSQIGQSYLPASTGFIIGVPDLMAFVGRQWHGRVHCQALGLQSPASTAAVGRQALTAIIALGAVWLLNDYRGVPTPVLLLTLLLLGGMSMATRTTSGRCIYAIGSNLEATCLSGINAERTKLAVFAINGLVVAIAGLILGSRFGAGSPFTGSIVELDAIATYVIGGTSLADGVGNIAGAAMGAFIMTSLDNGMSMMDVPTFWRYIVKDAIPLLAVRTDSVTKHRS